MYMFIDRDKEISMLEDALGSKRAEFVIVYGRRRVGKTELLKQILHRDEKAVYLLGRNETPRDLLNRLSREMGERLGDERLARFPFRSLDEAFYYVRERERLTLILDEFPYMVASEPGLLSILQDHWDNYLRSSDVKLFVCGSSMGMVERLLFDYGSPIYGRRTRQMKVEPLGFPAVAEMFPEADFDELHRIYSVLGGTPGYLLEYEGDIFDTIERKFLKKDQFLHKDAEIVLRAELREPRYYFSIIRSIASGNTSIGKIMNDTGLSKSVTSKYLSVLQDLDIIRRIWPVTEKASGRRGLYELRDNYFRFYFRFIYPYLEHVELGETEYLMERTRNNMPVYLGRTLEDIVIELIRQRPDLLPFRPSRTGRWWNRGEEIDLVAINEDTDEIIFCEIKSSGERLGAGTLANLKRKAEMVRWGKRGNKRKEYFMLISKDGFGEKVKGAICLDARELVTGVGFPVSE